MDMINPFDKFNKEWALVTAGNKDKFNSMTISWGSIGTLWFKNVVTIYIRPDRYTFEFLNNSDYFTLSFFDEKYRDKLTMFGRNSGRDIDKVKESGFSPVFLDRGITYKEAKETIVLKKIYVQSLDKDKFSSDILKCYNDDAPAHYMIIGEVVDIINRKNV